MKDSQGAVVPGVPIEAQNLATNEISHATPNEAGVYAFPVLPIGTYRITATAAGFKKAVQDNLELRLGDQAQQDFTLEVGAVTEQVTSTSAVAKKLVIAMEDAVTDEITATTTVAKKITVSGFEMADRFVRLEHDVLRGLIQGATRPLVVQNGTKSRAAK